jgi:hypothetical protein
MNMFIWTLTNPNRDGDFQQGIVVHEYTHGLSTRLTGGPANSNCLPSGEAGGMGEGWGDAMGEILLQKPTYTRDSKITMGAYVLGNTVGVRKYPYSSDLSVDPETYGYLKKSGYSEVHVIGEVWAGILHEVYWELREAKGHDADLFSIDVSTPEARSKAKGDITFLLNVVDGMKLQICKPTFIAARDSILAADSECSALRFSHLLFFSLYRMSLIAFSLFFPIFQFLQRPTLAARTSAPCGRALPSAVSASPPRPPALRRSTSPPSASKFVAAALPCTIRTPFLDCIMHSISCTTTTIPFFSTTRASHHEKKRFTEPMF